MGVKGTPSNCWFGEVVFPLQFGSDATTAIPPSSMSGNMTYNFTAILKFPFGLVLTPSVLYYSEVKPLVNVIEGGATQTLSVWYPWALDASASFDPSPPKGANYVQRWDVCKTNSTGICIPLDPYVDVFPDLVIATGLHVNLPAPPTIYAGIPWKITFTRTETTTQRSSSTSVIVTFEDLRVPVVKVRALPSAVSGRHNRHEPLILQALLTNSSGIGEVPLDDYFYEWSCDKINLDSYGLMMGKSRKQFEIGINANMLTLHSEYIFTLKVSSPVFGSMVATKIITMNDPPQLSCSSTSPVSCFKPFAANTTYYEGRIANRVVLSLAAGAFLDEHLPMFYRYTMIWGGDEYPISKENSYVLWYQLDPAPRPFAYVVPLLPNSVNSSQIVRFACYIRDNLGAESRVLSDNITLPQNPAYTDSIRLDVVLNSLTSSSNLGALVSSSRVLASLPFDLSLGEADRNVGTAISLVVNQSYHLSNNILQPGDTTCAHILALILGYIATGNRKFGDADMSKIAKVVTLISNKAQYISLPVASKLLSVVNVITQQASEKHSLSQATLLAQEAISSAISRNLVVGAMATISANKMGPCGASAFALPGNGTDCEVVATFVRAVAGEFSLPIPLGFGNHLDLGHIAKGAFGNAYSVEVWAVTHAYNRLGHYGSKQPPSTVGVVNVTLLSVVNRTQSKALLPITNLQDEPKVEIKIPHMDPFADTSNAHCSYFDGVQNTWSTNGVGFWIDPPSPSPSPLASQSGSPLPSPVPSPSPSPSPSPPPFLGKFNQTNPIYYTGCYTTIFAAFSLLLLEPSSPSPNATLLGASDSDTHGGTPISWWVWLVVGIAIAAFVICSIVVGIYVYQGIRKRAQVTEDVLDNVGVEKILDAEDGPIREEVVHASKPISSTRVFMDDADITRGAPEDEDETAKLWAKIATQRQTGVPPPIGYEHVGDSLWPAHLHDAVQPYQGPSLQVQPQYMASTPMAIPGQHTHHQYESSPTHPLPATYTEEEKIVLQDLARSKLFATAPRLGLQVGLVNGGVFVLNVKPSGPMGVAGIQLDDEVTALNTQAVNNVHDFYTQCQRFQPGELGTIEVLRDGYPQTYQFRVGAQISEPQYTTLQRISAGTFYWGDNDRLQYTDMEQDTAYAW